MKIINWIDDKLGRKPCAICVDILPLSEEKHKVCRSCAIELKNEYLAEHGTPEERGE